MDSVGERIKKTRLSQGLSQVELAKAAGVSQPTVANWENGSHIPRQAALNSLSGILNISTHWLLGGDQDQNGYAQIPHEYLDTPIRHVPILAWPNADDVKNNKIATGSAQDYISISTHAGTPFALLINHSNFGVGFPIGTAVIFEPECGERDVESYYLFAEDQHIVLRKWVTNTQARPLALHTGSPAINPKTLGASVSRSWLLGLPLLV